MRIAFDIVVGANYLTWSAQARALIREHGGQIVSYGPGPNGAELTVEFADGERARAFLCVLLAESMPVQETNQLGERDAESRR